MQPGDGGADECTSAGGAAEYHWVAEYLRSGEPAKWNSFFPFIYFFSVFLLRDARPAKWNTYEMPKNSSALEHLLGF